MSTATVTGSKTVTTSPSPGVTGATLTTLLAIPLESLTIAQFDQIRDAVSRSAKASNPAATVGACLP